MKKLIRKNLDELAKVMPVIEELQQASFIGGGTGTSDDPYTEKEFEAMCLSGTWQGGYVSQWGYTLPEVVSTGSGSIVNSFHDYNLAWLPAEGIGINGSFTVHGTTAIRNGEIIISLSAQNPYLGNGMEMKGRSELYVNGTLMMSGIFTLPSSYIYQAGTVPLGTVDFDLTPYHGHVEIKVYVSGLYDSGIGSSASNYSKTVYSSYR